MKHIGYRIAAAIGVTHRSALSVVSWSPPVLKYSGG
jgi:hypothetical protein